MASAHGPTDVMVEVLRFQDAATRAVDPKRMYLSYKDVVPQAYASWELQLLQAAGDPQLNGRNTDLASILRAGTLLNGTAPCHNAHTGDANHTFAVGVLTL